jgi:hypothetical protein
MNTEAYLFAAAFVTVFALGFQQQNVAGRHYLAAVFTSCLIGGAQLFLWRVAPTASASEIIATLAGGPAGIVAAMYVHPRIARRWRGKA